MNYGYYDDVIFMLIIKNQFEVKMKYLSEKKRRTFTII